MTVLLDIDNVLLPWGVEESEFYDWRKADHRNFSRYSPGQLELIRESFSDIRWHTTWIGGRKANTEFSQITGFGPWPIAIDEICDGLGDDIGPEQYRNQYRSSVIPHDLPWNCLYWWKLNGVARLLQAGKLPGFITWVDDDLIHEMKNVRRVLERFNALDRFNLIAPECHWTMASILEAKKVADDWNKSHGIDVV